MKQTIPLYQTTGINGFRITRIRTVARNGKSAEIEGQDACLKAVKREERLLDKGCGGRRKLVITIERKNAVCPDCGSSRAKYYKANVRLIQCEGFGRLKAYVENDGQDDGAEPRRRTRVLEVPPARPTPGPRASTTRSAGS